MFTFFGKSITNIFKNEYNFFTDLNSHITTRYANETSLNALYNFKIKTDFNKKF